MIKSESDLPLDKSSIITATAEVNNITIEAEALAAFQNAESVTAVATPNSRKGTLSIHDEISYINKIPAVPGVSSSSPSRIAATTKNPQSPRPPPPPAQAGGHHRTSIYDRSEGCEENVEIFNETRVSLVSICLFGGIFFVLSKMVNIAESKNSGVLLNWSFLIGEVVLTISEFSMMVYLLSIGFLTFFIACRYKYEIQRFVYVAAGHLNMDYEAQIILGFIIVIFCLPPWLYVRDYSVRCLIDRDCIFLLDIFQALSDCICGCHNSCEAPLTLTLCQAVMLSLPVTFMALVPAVAAIYVYTKYFHHHHSIFVPYCPPPIPDPVYRFS